MSQDASQPPTPPPGGGTGSQPSGGDMPLWGDQWSGAAPAGGEFGPPPSGDSAWAAGGVTFAGVLLLVNGFLNILQGISALAKDDVYTRVDDYVYRINLTGWGWILLIVGVIAAAVGAGILKGAEWARLTGIALAAVSMLFHFMFLPYAPIWAVIMIAIDIFVIWALATYRPHSQRPPSGPRSSPRSPRQPQAR
ncbi:hypothetical protein AB0912_04065 [Streptomyces sp. NPDC007084]|uniref:DUF7144 family membrane protein n=1 Tax=Streptomyces sp. NPDC007084 TaxID=3154313 RepID=UPI003454C938